jgi:hypothetical protein
MAFSRHSCRLVRCQMLNSSLHNPLHFSHCTSDRPRRRLPSGDRVFICLGHLLSSMRTTCPRGHVNK